MSTASDILSSIAKAGESIEKASAVLRVLGPVVEQVDHYIHGDGPEPAIFAQLPELRSPAALERARVRARST